MHFINYLSNQLNYYILISVIKKTDCWLVLYDLIYWYFLLSDCLDSNTQFLTTQIVCTDITSLLINTSGCVLSFLQKSVMTRIETILSGVSCRLMFLLLLCLAGFAPLSPSSSDLSLLVGVCQFPQQLYNRRDKRKNNYHTWMYFFFYYCKDRFDQQGASESHLQSDHDVFMSSAGGFCYLLTRDDSGWSY